MFKKRLKWYRVGSIADLEVMISEKKPKAMDVMGVKIVLCKTEEGELVALKDKCPHHGKPLSDGWCENNRIVCPYHKFSFDLETGLGSGTGVDKYRTKSEKGELFVGIDKLSLF